MDAREQLTALQDLDSAIDLVIGRIERLPERAVLKDAERALAALRTERQVADTEREAAEAAMATVESDSATIDAQKAALEGKLRTIISPREAEALQKEIATLKARRGALDDTGLELLEAIGVAEERVQVALMAEPAAQAAVDEAAAALDAAAGALAQERDELTAQRSVAAGVVEATLMTRYEAMRRRHGGMAVARLVGLQCTGCHLELSLAEAETVRHVPADQLADCPSCGRILVP